MKISIIGAGNVGALAAMHIARENKGQTVLVDIVKNMAKGKVFDMLDCRGILRVPYALTGSDEISSIEGSQVVVITAGLARKPGMTREDLLHKNAAILKDVCASVKSLCPEAIVVVVTNPLDAMTYYVLKSTGFPARRVLGMGISLDSSRMSNLISIALGCDVTDIKATVIGSHGETMVPLPRFTHVGSRALDEILAPDKQDEIIRMTRERGKEIVSLLGTGSAYFAPSVAIAQIVRCICDDAKEVIGVCAFLQGEYGLKDVCVGVPCRIGKEGISEITTLDLNQAETTALQQSAASIRTQIKILFPDYTL